jgi:hypothetical protein
MSIAKAVIVIVTALVMSPAFAQDKPVDNMQILAEKVRADKKLVVAVNMQLTESEAKGFWPVYEAYQKDLQKLNERLDKTIRAYAEAYNKGPLPNATAKKLLGDALAVEEEEVKLKRSYVPKLEKVLPPWKVARYMQIENKIRALVKYEIADRVPLVD